MDSIEYKRLAKWLRRQREMYGSSEDRGEQLKIARNAGMNVVACLAGWIETDVGAGNEAAIELNQAINQLMPWLEREG